MARVKHTPGPWVIREISPGKPSVGYSICRDLGKDGVSLAVALVPAWENAQLIAQLPDAVAAIEKVRSIASEKICAGGTCRHIACEALHEILQALRRWTRGQAVRS